MSRSVFLFLFLFFSPYGLAGGSFSLDQIADEFPSEGFEDQIGFWKKVFTQYGERDILIHDRDDLRLIYEVIHLDHGIPSTAAERQAQTRILQAKRSEFEALFGDLAREGALSSNLAEPHRKLVRLLEENGYALERAVFQRLRDSVRTQRGIRERFRDGLIRSGRYLGHIEEIFRGHGLPVELALLPHVESSFDYSAYSRAGAAGIWQFMPATGRGYLNISRSIDERLDPIKATDAAARHLKGNYQNLGNWPLAITAYNHGRNGMMRARNQHGDDLRVIIQKYESRLFGFASKNFYAEFLAAVEIAKNFEEYFGTLQLEPPLRFEVVQLNRSHRIDQISQLTGIDQATLRRYNPHLTQHIWVQTRAFPSGLQLRVPGDQGQRVAALIKVSPPEREPIRAVLAADTRSISSGAAGAGETYRVRQGDNLASIARSYGTSTRELQRLNSLSNPNRIQVGQVLRVAPSAQPGRETAPVAVATDTSAPARPAVYRVRRGDSLASIASRFGMSVRDLAALNQITNPNRIHPGQELVLANPESRPLQYLVQVGDSLASIARRFGTSVERLIEANGISNPNQLALGQLILIP